MTGKRTYEQKLGWLRKKHVIIKAKRASTVDRLYSFYQRNPLSTPRNLAYGLPKRIEKSIEKGKDFKTPKGKITAKQYVKKHENKQRKEIKTKLPSNITINFARYYKNVDKLMDWYDYRIRPPIVATNVTLVQARKRLQFVINDIIEITHHLKKIRGKTYQDYDIGGKLLGKTKNMRTADGTLNPPLAISLQWVHLGSKWLDGDIAKSLNEAFEVAVKTLNNPSAQENSVVILTTFALKFTTDKRPSAYDRLRM